MTGAEKVTFILQTMNQVVGILAFLSIIIGIRQLKIMKDDNRVKNERAAIEKSLKYLEWFADDFFGVYNDFRKQFSSIQNKLLSDESLSETTRDDIQKDINEVSKIRKGELIIEYDFSKRIETLSPYYFLMMTTGASKVLNRLEYFAAAMTCGIAKEELVFNPLAVTYCETVEELYYCICHARTVNDKVYTNIIQLYNIWKPKLDKEKLLQKQDELKGKIEAIQDVNIRSLGL